MLREAGAVRERQPIPDEDELTGLPTRRPLMQAINEQIAANPGGFALLFGDIDGLKDVNDTQGHPAGDQLIKTSAHTLEENARTEAQPGYDKRDLDKVGRVVFRWGGDELVVLLANTNSQKQVEGAQRRHQAELLKRGISISMGGRVHQVGETAEEFIAAIDEQMFKQKKARKAQEHRRQVLDLPPHKFWGYVIGRSLMEWVGVKLPR